MLLVIDGHRAICAHRMYGDPPGVRVFDKTGRETHDSLGGRSANFRQAIDGTLLLRYDDGVAEVDPSSQFAMRELRETDLIDSNANWSASFIDALVDTKRGCFARFKFDDAALAHGPETGPTDAILLPDRRRVAVLIHKTWHIAIFDPVSGTTVLIPLLAGHNGASNAIVRENTLWFVCYDTFCRLDLRNMTFSASDVLQPPFYDEKRRLMTSGFVGVPRFSDALSSWLLPRPYSGDILVMSGDTLSPVSRIPTGGKPYDTAEFDDGSLLIIDHPFDVVRAAHINDVVLM